MKNSGEKRAEARFSRKSAARRMVTNVPVVQSTATIAEVERLLTRRGREFETIGYIYVVDESRRLLGVLSVKEVFRLPGKKRVSSILKGGLVAARPSTHQERVAYLALKHSIKAVPIVDAGGVFLGTVPSDAIFSILHEEGVEDALHLAGLHTADPEKELMGSSAEVYYEKRIPWLVLGIFGGFLAAFIVGFFEHALNKMLILASFIPAIVYIADAVGVQTSTVLIRSIAVEQKMDLSKYLLRELKAGAYLAITISLLLGALSALWFGSPLLGLILGFSSFAAVIAAVAIAFALPILLRKLNMDPAVGAGPFATIITDLTSIAIYFWIASALILLLA